MSDPNPFSPAALSRSVYDTIEQAQAAMPKGARGGLLIDGTKTETGGQVEVAFVYRLHDNFKLVTGLDYDGHHVRGKVAAAWFF